MPSFEEINYSLRVNKNIERKLIVEVLDSLRPEFPVNQYRYVGFGSVWYVDFILMHKRLGISDLVSFEKEISRLDRAKFNQPFACINVIGGKIGEHITAIDYSKPLIAWLDYDDGLCGPMLGDVGELVQRAPRGSIIAVTSNADRRQLDIDIEGVARIDDKTEDASAKNREAVLRHVAGDAVPDPLPKDALTVHGFLPFVGRLLLETINHAVLKSGRAERAFPLFNFSYNDGAAMVTVGIILLDPGDASILEEKKKRSKQPFYFTSEQYYIEVPHLTRKEKLAFDQLLPTAKVGKITPKQLKFTIADRLIRSYERLYSYYPVFEELF